ncbi:hypothetical protein B0H16DRAFT_374963 [Mycena metata]|uniref:Uncharacterized protein n=1 Tax=Mycena metata TaxID=1033252 RepID=A0AAD7NMW7_9AGAR|nr:hypothetical protein B0H16DRAFT_374963 [Mycena metata]
MLAEGSGSRLSDADWYDPEESRQDLEHPKYWSEEVEEVIVGIKQRSDTTPMKLETLCGSYRFFYQFPEPGVSEPQNLDILYPPGTTPTRNQDNPGYLTISCPSGKQPTLKNITGTVVHFGKEGRFSGIKRAKDRENKNLVNNHWEFVTFKWKEDGQDDGNSILALEVADDAGEPFIMFRCAQSPAPKLGYMWYLDIAARKDRRLNSRSDSALSHGEMARLGMQAHYPEIRAAAQVMVKSEEESESESSSDDEVENPRPAGKRKLDPTGEESVRPKKRKPV